MLTLARSNCLTLELTFSANVDVKLTISSSSLASDFTRCKFGMDSLMLWMSDSNWLLVDRNSASLLSTSAWKLNWSYAYCTGCNPALYDIISNLWFLNFTWFLIYLQVAHSVHCMLTYWLTGIPVHKNTCTQVLFSKYLQFYDNEKILQKMEE